MGTPIQDFFRGAHVFITGGTGFIGKILTEKLVRSVPHLGQIYLLIRAKRGKSTQQRFQQLLEDPVFRRMKAEVPNYASKLTVVEGDISASGLGLSAADKHTLLDHVTMVIHSAADVRFIEPLRTAVLSNVTGSRSVLTLARGMANLKIKMVKEDEFDLSQFITESLSLQQCSNPQTKELYKKSPVNPLDKFCKLSPYEVLGETVFVKQSKIPEEVVGTAIQEFFRGAHVFITGGTGFIGKILIEKLVRSVPHLGQIYLLIRAKRGKSTQQRFQQLFEDPVFRRMKAEVPDYASKLTVVEGDISAPGLGLSAANKRILLDHVTMVIHSAADVRFIEPLRTAVLSNVTGSRSVLTLARGMTKLKSYVHVSTAYSQCVRRVVPETVPKMSVHYKEVLTLLDSLTDEEIEENLSKILQGWPNTYTFTKAMTEQMLDEEGEGLPICIFRPAAVINTYNEPVRGWTDNMYGPLGLLVAIGMGLLHCINQDIDISLDMVPVDYTVNCLITCAWDSLNHRSQGVVPVYNYVSSPSNAVSWKYYATFGRIIKDTFSIQQSVWYFSLIFIENSKLHDIAHFILHRIPGIILDKIAVWNGQKARLSKVYSTIHKLKKYIAYFVVKNWEFESENVQKMLSLMSPEDKTLFNFDIRTCDSFEHILLCKMGIRYYFLKEKMETLPQAQKKNTVFWWLHNMLKCVCGLVVLKVLVIMARALPI